MESTGYHSMEEWSSQTQESIDRARRAVRTAHGERARVCVSSLRDRVRKFLSSPATFAGARDDSADPGLAGQWRAALAGVTQLRAEERERDGAGQRAGPADAAFRGSRQGGGRGGGAPGWAELRVAVREGDELPRSVRRPPLARGD